MTYNLTQIFTGGPVEQVNGLTVQSNYVFLDALLLLIFIVILVILSTRDQGLGFKQSLFAALAVTFVVSGLLSFAVAASGASAAALIGYSTRTIVYFSMSLMVLLWNVLSS